MLKPPCASMVLFIALIEGSVPTTYITIAHFHLASSVATLLIEISTIFKQSIIVGGMNNKSIP